jgi:hypothetical protein
VISQANAAPTDPAVRQFLDNMKSLFKRLGDSQRKAIRELTTDRVSKRIDRAKDKFARDFPQTASREQGLIFCEEVLAVLTDDEESDNVRVEIQQLKRKFDLESDITLRIEGLDEFKEAIDKLKYVGRLSSQGGDLLVTPIKHEQP